MRLPALVWMLASLCVAPRVEASLIRADIVEVDTYQDMPVTVFSPTGRLHSVERVHAAVEDPSGAASSNLVVAIQTSQGIVVMSTLPGSAYVPSTQLLEVAAQRALKEKELAATEKNEVKDDVKDDVKDEMKDDGNSSTAINNSGDFNDDDGDTATTNATSTRNGTDDLRRKLLATKSKSLFRTQQSRSALTAPFTVLSPHPLLVATAGLDAHGRVLRSYVGSLAEASSLSLFEPDTLSRGTAKDGRTHTPSHASSMLARMVADDLQISTQTIDSKDSLGKLLSSCALIIQGPGTHSDGEITNGCSGDDADADADTLSGQIWQVDPNGQFWRCQATAVGCNANKARAELLTAIQERMNATSANNETMSTLQTESASEDSNATSASATKNNITMTESLNELTLAEAIQIAKRCIRASFKKPIASRLASLATTSNSKSQTSDANQDSKTDPSATATSQVSTPPPASVDWEAVVFPASKDSAKSIGWVPPRRRKGSQSAPIILKRGSIVL